MDIQLIMAGEVWYLDSKLWVLIPVILFFVLVAVKGGFKAMGSALDGRADAIRSELDEAARLREEAQALLASYQRKQAEAEEQAQEIVARARREAEAMATRARADLAERLERRAAQAEAKIANAEAQALSEVRSRVTDLSINAAKDLAAGKMTAAEKTAFFKSGLEQMDGMLKH